MSLRPTSNDTPAYPTQSRRTNSKLDRKRLDSSTRTFIELDDRTESQDDLERGVAERGSVKSQTSETPIYEKLTPLNGKKGYGCSATVAVIDVDGPRIGAEEYDGIMMTRTINQSRHNRT